MGMDKIPENIRLLVENGLTISLNLIGMGTE